MIYLDHNATSPLLPEVRDAMEPWLGVPANPASVHQAGQRAAVAVEEAREAVTALVGGRSSGVVFTSGATEANHTFIRGWDRLGHAGAIAVSPIEHPCVLAAVGAVDRRRITLSVGADGVVALDSLTDVGLVCLMAANHETGVIQPVSALLDRAEAEGFAVHVDATQAAGRVPLDLGQATGVALSSHKLGGPSGVGALVLQDGEPFPALLTGGSQERGRRAGTVNVAGVVGFGAACRLALAELEDRRERWSGLRERVVAACEEAGGRIIGEAAVPNTVCAVFDGVESETLVQALDLMGICVSAGAACASGSLEPSPVLTAMGDPGAGNVLRISLGPRSTSAEVGVFEQAIGDVVRRLRAAW